MSLVCAGSIPIGGCGQRVEPAEAGSTIIRLLTRCGMGSDTTVDLYLIVPRKAGGIYVTAMYATGGEDAAETVDSGIRAAVFRALPK